MPQRGKIRRIDFTRLLDTSILGIIIMTFGLTIMSAQFQMGADSKILYTWLIQVFGYLMLAGYEERHLLTEHEKEYSHTSKGFHLFFS